VELYVTPTSINSRKVQVDRATEREARDPVVSYMEKPLEFIRQNFRMEPLPPALARDPALLKGRVDSLLASEPRNRLAVLAEIRAYQARGLLDVSSFKAACQKLLHDNAAEKLAGETPLEVKLQSVQRWLPKLRLGPTPAIRED
jgi:hypothetical protein